MQFIRCLLIMTSAILFSGCASLRPTVQGGAFADGMAAAVVPISEDFKKMNAFEVDLRVTDHMVDDCSPSCKHLDGVKLIESTYNEADIKARLGALKALKLYAKAVADLVGSTGPDDASASFKAIGEKLSGIKTTIEESNNNADALRFAEPLTSIISILMRENLERERDKHLSKAIIDTDAPIRKILDLVVKDYDAVLKLQFLAGLAQENAKLSAFYNNNAGRLTSEQRLYYLNRIKDVSLQYRELSEFDANELVDGIRSAQDAMLVFAKSKKKSGDIYRLNEALESFAE